MANISVAIATFNGSRFLADQLVSIATQSRLPDEIVISDDGSNDDTLAVLNRFSATSPIPIYIHSNELRIGYRANFMKACGLCQGDIIAFCDQDDVWDPKKLEIIEKHFRIETVLMVNHNACSIDERGSTIAKNLMKRTHVKLRAPLSEPTTWANPPGHAMAIRRSLCNYTSLWKNSICRSDNKEPAAHDQWFSWLAFSLGSTTYDPRELTRYRVHDRNQFGLTKSPVDTATECARLSIAVQRFVEIMIAARANGTFPEGNAIAKNKRLAEMLERRSKMKLKDSLPQTLDIFKMLIRGDYSFGRWRLGNRAFTLDLGHVFGF